MFAAASFIFLTFSLLLYLAHKKKKDYNRRRGVPYPPSPPAHPIVGHLFKFPRPAEEDRFAQYAHKYGESHLRDVVYFHVLGKDVIVLNSEQCAIDLLEKRSIIYSSRPWLPGAEMMGWGDLLAVLPYGPSFHKTRKSFQEALSKKECLMYQDVQLRQSRILLRNLLNNPSKFSLHLTTFTSSIVTEVTYGYRITSNDDPYITMAEEFFSIINPLGDFGRDIIDVFPFLRHIPAWVPGAWYAKYAKEYRPKAEAILDEPFAELQKRISLGTAQPCFLSYRLEELQSDGPMTATDYRKLKMDALQLYTAGAETASSVLLLFILSMVYNPQAQKIAQEELDKVVGPDRLPDFADKDSLPYICLDWNLLSFVTWPPFFSTGVPHCTTEDDVYNNMFIPKGTVVVTNQRLMLSDPNTYRDPHLFLPERFLAKPNGYEEPLPTCIFGFGRRACPGKILAEASLWIVITSILSTFDIMPCQDDDGNPILPPMEFDIHLTSRPKDLKCLIRPRTSQHASLVENWVSN
ncbi:cytochrome P450 [Abortiporus biennis]|nr:cytochrome P450 [Abortiporus biennis]